MTFRPSFLHPANRSYLRKQHAYTCSESFQSVPAGQNKHACRILRQIWQACPCHTDTHQSADSLTVNHQICYFMRAVNRVWSVRCCLDDFQHHTQKQRLATAVNGKQHLYSKRGPLEQVEPCPYEQDPAPINAEDLWAEMESSIKKKLNEKATNMPETLPHPTHPDPHNRFLLLSLAAPPQVPWLLSRRPHQKTSTETIDCDFCITDYENRSKI